MFNRGNVLLALSVFGAVFCVTFWRDSLFHNLGLAMENAPLTAREYQSVTTVTDLEFKKAREQVHEARGGGNPADTTALSMPGPQNSRVATLAVGDANRLCHMATFPDRTERWIVDYDDSHFNERDSLKFTWRTSGCEAAIKARGELVTYAQAIRRRAGVIPRTEPFAAERAAKTSHVWYLEHDRGNPPDDLPLL